MHDLPVRLKRSFEEVCLKYSTRYQMVRNCSVSFAKIRGRSFIPVPGTCTNHLITDYFLMYPGGTRATCVKKLNYHTNRWNGR